MAKAIIFQEQVSSPIPSGKNGIWINSSNQMVFVNTANQSQNMTVGASGKGVFISVMNNTGATIVKGAPVSVNSTGELQLLDVTVFNNASNIIGVVFADAANATVATVCTSGVIENLSTSIVMGKHVYANVTTGGLYGGEPTIGLDGFLAGHHMIRLGVIFQNAVTSGQKDFSVNFQLIGIL